MANAPVGRVGRGAKAGLEDERSANQNSDVLFFLMVPPAVILSVEWNVVVSSRASDVRLAQQIGYLLILPFSGICVGGEMNLVDLSSTSNLLIISGALLVVDLLLLLVARVTFRREEILTRWRWAA